MARTAAQAQAARRKQIKRRGHRKTSAEVLATKLPDWGDIAPNALAELRREPDPEVRPEDYDPVGTVPVVFPSMLAPTWHSDLGDIFQRAFGAVCGQGEPVQACYSAPPQTGKSLTISAAVARWLEMRPQDLILFISYSQGIAEQKSQDMRDAARELGVQIRPDHDSKSDWRTYAGGGVAARGLIDGQITGLAGARLIVIDDSIKGRKQADSAVVRHSVIRSYQSNVSTRLHADTSIILCGTRWHELDLIGFVQDDEPGAWEVYAQTPYHPDGSLWCPELLPEHLIRRKRKDEHDWFSLYEQRPRPRDVKPFRGRVSYYTDLPSHYSIALGVDLAYSAKKTSDYSVCAVMARSGARFYILHISRVQKAPEDFALTLRGLQERYPGAPTLLYGAGRDHEEGERIRALGVNLAIVQASADKYVRSLGFALAWREGRVFLPMGAPWVADLLKELEAFTGTDDRRDDQVDALSAAFDQLEDGGAAPWEQPSRDEIDRILAHRYRRDSALRGRSRRRAS